MAFEVAVLGAGAWGTALGAVLAERGGPVALWGQRRELCDAVERARENVRYLPGVRLPDRLRCTHDLGAALEGAKWVVFAVPSHAMRAVAREASPHVRAGAPVCVSATKGIETGTLRFMNEVLAEELPRRRA